MSSPHRFKSQDHYLSLNESGRSGHVRIEGLSLPPQKLTFALTFRSRVSGDEGLVSYASPSQSNEFLVVDNSGGPYIYIGGQLVHRTGYLFSNDAWQDLVVTWDGTTGQVHMFNNGSYVARQSGAFATAKAPLDGNGVLILGQDQDSFGGGFQASQALRGDIAKLTIWDRVLEADEIEDGPDTGDAVHHFAFDEGSGTTVQDQRGGLQAQIIGDVTWKDVPDALTSENVKLAGEVQDGTLDVSDVSSGLSLDVAQLKDVTHVIATDHNDTLTGDALANRLEGHDGDDTLTGHDGDDVLVGGLGADTKTGGEGADTFVYRTSAETIGDIITDFNPDEDTLDFSAFGSSLTFSEEGPKAKSLWTEVRDDGLHLLGDTDGDTSSTEIDLTFRSLEALGSSPTGSGSAQSASGGPAAGSAPPEPIYVLQSPTVYRAPGDASSVGSSGSPAVLGGTNGGSSFGSSLDFSSLANQGFSSSSLSRGSVPDLSGFAGSHGHGLSSQAPDLSGVSSSSGNNIPDGMTGISAGDPTLDSLPSAPSAPKTIPKDVVDTASRFLQQGKVHEAWKALADGGDNYAWSAAKITDPTSSSFAKTLVKNTWENTVGSEVYEQRFDAVAHQHCDNYIKLVKKDGKYILPMTEGIEKSYARALGNNGVSTDAAVDGLLNTLTGGTVSWTRVLDFFDGEWGNTHDIDPRRISPGTALESESGWLKTAATLTGIGVESTGEWVWNASSPTFEGFANVSNMIGEHHRLTWGPEGSSPDPQVTLTTEPTTGHVTLEKTQETDRGLLKSTMVFTPEGVSAHHDLESNGQITRLSEQEAREIVAASPAPLDGFTPYGALDLNELSHSLEGSILFHTPPTSEDVLLPEVHTPLDDPTPPDLSHLSAIQHVLTNNARMSMPPTFSKAPLPVGRVTIGPISIRSLTDEGEDHFGWDIRSFAPSPFENEWW